MKFIKILLFSMLMLQGFSAAAMESFEKLDYEDCRELVSSGEILSMAELMALVKDMSEGRIIETSLLKKGTVYIYEMEIAGTNGMIEMLYIDARTGAISHTLEGDEQKDI
ncbi:PepSY domain-containing protein [Aliamphritea spongicola]|uniref:PepSY domain-containing protein n=1 Tax=Aliamphritea spongicola TaxID=707589 RepID=UPI00196AEB29|nr:hypothetical protein [Aliamphritea spongicola]MBN3564055.1 hypothetical protein [Aliamphritea spongicola]